MIRPSRSHVVVLAFALLGCGRSKSGDTRAEGAASGGARALPSGSSPAPVASGSASAPPPASASAVPLDPPSPPPPPASFVGAKGEKACKAQTVELGGYQQRGEVELGGRGGVVGATWRVRLPNRPQLQVAFASFDKEGKPLARARGVGTTMVDVPPRVFASGPGAPSDMAWTVVWYDEKGLAYTRPRVEKLPAPETAHLGALGPASAGDVALAESPAGAVLAAAPFGADKAQLGVFLFAPAESVTAVKALGVTHHAKAPRRPVIAGGESSTFVLWDEGGALLGSRFDAAGKENEAPCAIAPAGTERDRVAVVPVKDGAMALWMEGSRVRTRALDASGCPRSPVWTVAEGRWATLAALDGRALVAWVAPDGHLLAARLQPDGSPPPRGLDAAEGSTGVKDPPDATAFGAGKVAFAWSEAQSAVEAGKRLVLRIVDASCIP